MADYEKGFRAGMERAAEICKDRKILEDQHVALSYEENDHDTADYFKGVSWVTGVIESAIRAELANQSGDWDGNKCPRCGCGTLSTSDGKRWCSFVGCDWVAPDHIAGVGNMIAQEFPTPIVPDEEMARMVEVEPDPKVYIWSRKYTLGIATWWRPNGAGYTTNLRDAGLYTMEDAQKITELSGGDAVIVPQSTVGTLVSRLIIDVGDSGNYAALNNLAPQPDHIAEPDKKAEPDWQEAKRLEDGNA